MRALTRFAFALFVGMTLCLAAATFVEKAEGTEFAARTIYHSGWFVLWWALLAVSALTVVADTNKIRNDAKQLFTLSFICFFIS